MAVIASGSTVRTLSLSAVAVAASVGIPLLVHVLPGGSAIGAALLPIFWAPLLAILLFGAVPAAIAALLAPLLNHLLTGMPPEFVVGSITAELTVFVAVLTLAVRSQPLRRSPFLAPLAYLVARVAVGAVAVMLGDSTSGWPGLLRSIPSAWPGLVTLFVIALAVGLVHRRPKRS